MNKEQKGTGKIRPVVRYLIGNEEHFSFGTRIFHSANLITAIFLFFIVPFNWLLGLSQLATMLSFVFCGHLLIYYLSRFMNLFALALAAFMLLTYSGLSGNYYFNSGIEGPTLLVSFFIFQLLISVTKQKYHLAFMLFNALVIGGLILADYQYSGWIRYSHKGRGEQFLDIYVAYVTVLLFSYIIIRSLLNSYYRQKKEADNRTIHLAQKNDELKRITQEKEKLFSIIFHDLKSPLASIQQYLETLVISVPQKDEEDMIKESLLQMTKETSGMLENMLLWVKEQVNSTSPKTEPMIIANVIALCINIEKHHADKKNITLHVNIGEDLHILADVTMMQLLLRIIINNAIKFSPFAGFVEINARKNAGRCLISVKDSGIGIPLDKQGQLFTLNINPSNGTNNEKGSGLGLMLAKQFADRQGIDFWFESTPGNGACFFLAVNSLI